MRAILHSFATRFLPRRPLLLGLAAGLALSGAGCLCCPRAATRQAEHRDIELRYAVAVANVPAGAAQLDLWLPCPPDTPHQEVREVAVTSPFRHALARETRLGNRVIHLRAERPPASFELEARFTVRRYVHDPAVLPDSDRGVLRVARGPERLVPLSGEARALAETIVRDERDVTGKARALYAHVLEHMTYDKSGQGWGRGCFTHARTVGRGNCTDYHAYFIGLCRNLGIPAFFEVGLSVPESPPEGPTGAYHCWAYFWDGGKWVPVDISEADQQPQRRDYLFGHLDYNRVAFSRGRDLVLEPRQRGEPINFFIDPYVEVDGVPHGRVSRSCTYSPPGHTRLAAAGPQ